MFGIFGKKGSDSADGGVRVIAPCSGRIVDITEVPDAVFSGKMMGDGIAIWQEGAEVCAPVDGELTLIAETKHAFGITTPEGVQLLVHVGLETVELGGQGFDVLVKAGQKVKAGDPVLRVDMDLMHDKGIEMIVPVVVLGDDYQELSKENLGSTAERRSTVVASIKK